MKKINNKIDELANLKGLIVAGVTDQEGNLFRLEGAIGGAQAQWLVKTGKVNMALARTEVHAGRLFMNQGPEEKAMGWMVVGPINTYIVIKRYGVMLKNSEADFNKAIKLLLEASELE